VVKQIGAFLQLFNTYALVMHYKKNFTMWFFPSYFRLCLYPLPKDLPAICRSELGSVRIKPEMYRNFKLQGEDVCLPTALAQ
jgi:hypothetical protein